MEFPRFLRKMKANEKCCLTKSQRCYVKSKTSRGFYVTANGLEPVLQIQHTQLIANESTMQNCTNCVRMACKWGEFAWTSKPVVKLTKQQKSLRVVLISWNSHSEFLYWAHSWVRRTLFCVHFVKVGNINWCMLNMTKPLAFLWLHSSEYFDKVQFDGKYLRIF